MEKHIAGEPPWIIGLNAPPLGWHDPAACLVDGTGHVVALVEEERPSRVKHGLHRYPVLAVRECLSIAGLSPKDIDIVAVGWDLPRHWSRTDRDALRVPLGGRVWEYDDWSRYTASCLGIDLDKRMPDLVFVPHHTAHAVSTFFASGWKSAAVLIVDGNGDDESVSIYKAELNKPLRRVFRLPVSHSLGYLYDAVGNRAGFNFLEAGKTMGLAAYGRSQGLDVPDLLDFEKKPFDIPIDVSTSAEHDEIIASWREVLDRVGLCEATDQTASAHRSNDAVRAAWSVQRTLERAMLSLCEHARLLTGETRLCLAGGVALNCSANGHIPEPVYVPPVPHDAGVALGAAWHLCRSERTEGEPLSPYLGRSMGRSEVVEALAAHDLELQPFSAREVARLLHAGHIGALCVGKAETGPRALCHRSMIASPVNAETADRVNDMKNRERWRPLSPVALAQAAGVYWESSLNLHRYMLGAVRVTLKARREIPAVVHVDSTARPQTVEDDSEPVFKILVALVELGHPPVLMNTSFNNRDVPIVNSAHEAVQTAETMGLSFVVFDCGMVRIK